MSADEDEASASPVMANCFSRSIVLAPSRALGLLLLEPSFELFGCHIDQLVELADLVRRNRSHGKA